MKRLKITLNHLLLAILFISCSEKQPPPPRPIWHQAQLLYDGMNFQEAYDVYHTLSKSALKQTQLKDYYFARAQMAFCLWRTYRSEAAWALADSILNEVPELLDTTHETMAMAYTVKGNILCDKRTQKDYQATLTYYHQALSIYEQHYSPPSKVLAYAWERLGIARFLIDDYMAAIPFYEQSLKMLDKPSVDNVDTYFKVEGNLGLQYGGMGQHQKAIEQYKKARQILSAFKIPPDARLATSFYDQSISELALGDWAAALISLEQAWGIDQEYGEESNTLRPFILEGFANCYRDQKQWSKALKYYQLSLNYWNENDIDHRNALIQTWQNKGQCYLAKQQYKQAQVLFKKADSLAQKAYGQQHLNRLKPLLFLQQIDRQNGHYQQAEKRLKKGLSIALDQLGHHHPLVAKVYYQKALLEREKKQWSKALKLCKKTQEALKVIPKKVSSMANSSAPQLFLEAAHLEAKLLLQQGFLSDAAQQYQRTLLYTDTLWYRIETYACRRFVQKRLPKLAEEALPILHQLWQKTKDSSYFEQAIWLANQCRSKALRYERAVRQFSKFLPDSIFENGKTLQKNVQFYEQLLRESTTPLDSFPATNWRKQLQKKHRKYSEWKNKWSFETRNPLKKESIISMHQLEEWSDETASDLIIYVYENNKIHRLGWIKGAAFWDILKYNSDQIASLNRWKFSLSHPPQNWQNDQQLINQWQQFIQEGHLLYEWLIPPQINASTNTLVIMPDGLLHAFPFAALLTEKAENKPTLNYRKLPYLFQKRPLRYAYDMNDALSEGPLTKNPAYVAYAPAYWKQTDWSKFKLADSLRLVPFKRELQNIPALPNTLHEIQNGQNLFRGHIYEKEQALESTFLQNAAHADILHIATHAWLHPKDPHYTALLLHPDQQTNGWFFSRTLESGQLSANLVILSSCYSGQGIDIPGEGISSLGRTFLAIGCSKVLISSWALDDVNNADIITRFMTNINHLKPSAEALHISQKDYLREVKNDAYAHPYYWAALSLCGKGG